MFKRILLVILTIQSLLAHAQPPLLFQNPSFEGVSCAGCAPAPWNQCFGSPDVQPGQWGFTDPATDGNTYISFLVEGGNTYSEGVSQQLSSCMVAGTEYTFTMDIAFSSVYLTAEPGNCYGSIAIWGGNADCGTDQLLWSSGQILTPGWNNVTVTFTPTSNWCYATLAPIFLGPCQGYINGAVDNISPIVPAQPGINITSPTANSNNPCSFLVTGTSDSLPNSVVLTGSFTGSPLNATILTDSTWQAFVDYPDNLNGQTQIIATGNFPGGIVLRDTVVFNLIDIVPSFTTDTVCTGNPTQFTDLTTITNPGTIANRVWKFGDGNTGAGTNPTHTYAAAGSYTATLVVTSNAGCVDSVQRQVLVVPGATANFQVTTGCVGTPAVFQDLSVSTGGVITGWNWDFGNGTGTSTQQNPVYNYPAGGNYTVTLALTVTGGCNATTTQNISIDDKPTAQFTVNPAQGCAPLTVALEDNSLANGAILDAWDWTISDGQISTLQDPIIVCPIPGIYDVTLIVTTAGGCSDTAVVVGAITVFPQVTAAFVNSPQITTEFDREITFSDQSTNATQWDWDFDDGQTSTQQNPVIAYADTGFYTITLIANNQFNCPDTAQGVVVINPLATFFVPSAFTPNGDGNNDVFMGKGTNIKTYEMAIFNRWGDRVFTTLNPALGWDGTERGTPLCTDVYVYRIKLTNTLGDEQEYRGKVVLLR